MRIAIVDDSLMDALLLEKYLRQYCEEKSLAFTHVHYKSATDFLEHYQPCFDLIIMDIDMPGINGVDAARRLRAGGDNVVLMFVTNMPQYALSGFEVQAVDYILKPVAYQTFALKLERALRFARRDRESVLALHTAEGMARVSTADVGYVESILHYLVYHTEGEDYKVRGTMVSTEKELQPFRFVRCSSGILVNVRHVKAIEKDEVIVGNARLKISRGRRLEFMNAFTKYLGGIEL